MFRALAMILAHKARGLMIMCPLRSCSGATVTWFRLQFKFRQRLSRSACATIATE